MDRENPPEFLRPADVRQGFVVPAEMFTTPGAKRQAPAVTGKPGVGLGGPTVACGSGTGIERMEVAADARGIREDVAVDSPDLEKPVGVGDR